MSLARAEYYGNPRNAFWRLVGGVIEIDLVPLSYGQQLETLRRARIGLSDVIASAVRPGSLDSAIRDAEHNDLAGLIGRLPDLRAVAFNGGKASLIGRRRLTRIPHPDLLDLPSSSSAHAGMPFAEKLRRWSVLGRYLA